MEASKYKKAQDLSTRLSQGLGPIPKKAPMTRAYLMEAPAPSTTDLMAIIEPLVRRHIESMQMPEVEVTPEMVKKIIAQMHSLPENDKLEVSKGIRNASSFIYNGTKYGTHEMMHGGANTATTSNINVLVATGTVNDSNVTFTFTAAPSLVAVNGTNYRENHGWTISGLTVTLANPVGTGGDIYGIA